MQARPMLSTDSLVSPVNTSTLRQRRAVFKEVVITPHPAAEHRWISGLTSPAAGFAA